MVAAKTGGAVVLVLLTVASAFAWHDPRRTFVAGLAAAGVAVFALRDLLVPVRLAADPDGVIVAGGFGRRIRLPWSAIEAVRVDARSRHGVRSTQLEIDAGDSIHLFTLNDLSTPLDEVAATLAALRTGERGGLDQRQDGQ